MLDTPKSQEKHRLQIGAMPPFAFWVCEKRKQKAPFTSCRNAAFRFLGTGIITYSVGHFPSDVIGFLVTNVKTPPPALLP